MSFLNAVKAFFSPRKSDPAASAAVNAFGAASDAMEAALDAIEPHTRRANDRDAIDDAIREPENAYLDAGATPYSEAELQAHSAASVTLRAALDNLTAAFARLGAAEPMRCVSAELYQANCDLCNHHANAFVRACLHAECAALTAIRQAQWDQWQATLLERRATNPGEPEPLAIRTKAAALKAKSTENAPSAERLRQKASLAATEAKALRTKVQSAQNEAAAALETCQSAAGEAEDAVRT